MRIARMILAGVVGLVVGSIVIMGLVMVGPQVFPPPGGADVTTMEGLKASLHLFEPRHFVFPFLAHALGTFVGAWLATLVAPGRSPVPGWIVGVLFLAGGIANVMMLPAPYWFSAVDLIFAYLPMAWLALKVAGARETPGTIAPVR